MLALLLSAAAAVALADPSARYGAVGPVHAATIHHPRDDHPRHVMLRNHRIDTRAHPGLDEDHHRRLEREDASTVHQFLVHTERTLTAEESRDLEAAVGMSIGVYVPHNTYLMELTAAQARAAKQHRLVSWLSLFHPEFKGAADVPDMHAGLTDEAISLHVVLAPRGGKARRTAGEVQAVADRWNKEFVSAGFPTRVTSVDGDKIEVTTIPPLGRRDDPRAGARNVAEFVAHFPEAHYIEVKPVFETFNRYAAGVTQGGSAQTTTLWDRGLTGAGQIVGVGDSGIDYDSCFFYDENVQTPISQGASNEGGIDQSHRKIVNYHAMPGADALDDPDGHGTHVAGTAAGSTFAANSPLAEYNGMARDAKIAFLDIGLTGGGLSGVPNNLYSSFFPLGYAAGARIHTNSWGVPCAGRNVCYRDGSGLCQANAYTQSAAETDDFMWENQDMLVLFAAGNDGSGACTDGGNLGFHTTASPAIAKNILSVGATLNTPEAHLEYCAYLSSIGVIGDPTECNNFYASQADVYQQRTQADFSSRGPTRDLRIKPDISAPGNPMFSARSDGNVNTNNCGENPDDVLLSGGTSMATPAVAGNAALVRQYLQEGWYPAGEKRAKDAIEPSAALVKALIIGSGQSMTSGYVDILGSQQFSQLDDTPSNFYGFGAVQLDQGLYFKDEVVQPTKRLIIEQINKQDKTIVQGEVHEVCYKIEDPSVPFKVTLVWTDPAATSAVGVNLVNDLDLVVLDPLGSPRLGNGPFSLKYGAATEEPDRRNNVEQVVIAAPVVGEYCVQVTATTMGYQNEEDPQRYALVATAGFDPKSVPASRGGGGGGSSSGSDAGVAVAAIVGIGAVVAVAGFAYKKRQEQARLPTAQYASVNTSRAAAPAYVPPQPAGRSGPAYVPPRM